MSKISIAGLKVDTLAETQINELVTSQLQSNKKTFIITPYSEFLLAAMKDSKVMALLNSADISIPDGIAILLARSFLAKPLNFSNNFLKKVQGWWQIFWLGWQLVFWPQKVYGPFTGKIVGADFIWNLARIAEQENKSIYILGGFRDTPKIAGQKLVEKFPQLQIAGTSNKYKNDPTIINDIQTVKPDILLVGFGPITQERWIKDNWDQLPVSLAIGLGGTFDYIAGTKIAPPKLVRKIGLEWLYRLFTQPQRASRIKNATFGLVNALVNYKSSL